VTLATSATSVKLRGQRQLTQKWTFSKVCAAFPPLIRICLGSLPAAKQVGAATQKARFCSTGCSFKQQAFVISVD
jgi:hypothetical protein